MKRSICFNLLFFAIAGMMSIHCPAQFLNKIQQKAQQKLDKGIDKKVDEGLDKAEQKMDSSANNPKYVTNKKEETPIESSSQNASKSSDKETEYVSSYKSKFDFIPGEKVLILDDFSQDNVGDFPDKWNTTGSGEIVTIDGSEGKWLMMKARSSFIMEDIKTLPEDFTIQFDLMCSVPYDWGSRGEA